MNLVKACHRGCLRSVKIEVKNGVEVDRTTDFHGNHALSIAAALGHLEIVMWLISWGANPSVVGRRGETPLLFAAVHGRLDVVQWLLEVGGAVVTEADFIGGTALLNASWKGHIHIVQWLLLYGGASADECSLCGSTALIRALTYGHFNVALWLLQGDWLDVTYKTADGTGVWQAIQWSIDRIADIPEDCLSTMKHVSVLLTPTECIIESLPQDIAKIVRWGATLQERTILFYQKRIEILRETFIPPGLAEIIALLAGQLTVPQIYQFLSH